MNGEHEEIFRDLFESSNQCLAGQTEKNLDNSWLCGPMFLSLELYC
jgi:hypothetical protein